MAEHKINVIIAAKNKVSATLGKIGEGIKKFGKAIKKIALGITAAIGSVVAVATKAVAAYSVQEQAERRLIAAHEAFGEAGAELIENEKAIASAIQNETAVGDELTLSRMGQLRMLGVTSDKLEEAAKGVIGLTNAGMADQTAIRAMSAALQGNYTMLQRYIPALRMCANDQEKAALVNKFVTASYEQQKATLDTTSGRWSELKGRVGDAWEVLGQGINESADVSKLLKLLADKVLELSNRMTEWIATGGVAKAVAGLQRFAAIARSAFEQAGIYILKWGETAVYWLGYPFRYAGSVIGAYVNAIYTGIMQAVEWVKFGIGKLKGEEVPPPDTAEFKGAMKELGDSIMGQGALFKEQREDHAKNQEHYEARLVASEQRLGARLTEIDGSLVDKLQAISDRAQKIPPAPSIVPDVGEEEARAAAWTKQQEETLREERDRQKKLYDELSADIADGEAKIGKIKADAAKKQAEIRKRDLDQAVKDKVAADRQQRRDDKRFAREESRADRLQKRLDDGQNIGRANQRWLDQFNQRKKDMDAAAAKAKNAEETLKSQLETQKAIKASLDVLDEHLKANLTAR